jgi:release factor glutamine methyltransferase
MATVGELLVSATARLRESGSESARLDAELLLGWAIGMDRTGVIAHPESPVGARAEDTFETAVARRERGEPVAYIRGIKEFHGLAFSVDARALIPRPETELLVSEAEYEVAWRLTSAPRPAGTANVRVVDVGTGSGAIAIALAAVLRRRRMLPEVTLLAVDCSADALALAKENAVAHGLADSIEFEVADLLPEGGRPAEAGGRGSDRSGREAAAPEHRAENASSAAVVGSESNVLSISRETTAVRPAFDLILANLPYIPSAEVDRLPVAASFEPRVALDGGPDGLSVVRQLVAELPSALAPEGTALLEMGFDQGPAVEGLVAVLPGEWSCRIQRDLSGRPRLAHVERLRAGQARAHVPASSAGFDR